MRYNNECYNKLLELVENNENWIDILKQKPYSLKSIKQCPWNSNWYMLVYNLFESDLVNPIVKACRGSVIDVSDPKDVKVICAPYLKFCNLGEFPDEDAKIDWKSVWVSEKIDGILIKACKYKGLLYWFTNGSFTLDAPLMGKSDKYLEDATDDCETFRDLLRFALNKTGDISLYNIDDIGLVSVGGWCDIIPEGATLCFELVSPKNKIICDYPETKLYLHGYRNEKLDEHTAYSLKLVSSIKVDIPEVFNFNELTPKVVKAFTDSFDGSAEEGVVICDKNWHRAKIKSDSYLHLKFLRDVDNVSDKVIFKYILSDEIDDMTTEGNRYRVNKIKEKVEKFLTNYSFMQEHLKEIYKECGENRAAFAKRCSEHDLKNIRHICFKIIDGVNGENFIKKAYASLGSFKKFENDFKNLLYSNNLWMTKEYEGKL